MEMDIDDFWNVVHCLYCELQRILAEGVNIHALKHWIVSKGTKPEDALSQIFGSMKDKFGNLDTAKYSENKKKLFGKNKSILPVNTSDFENKFLLDVLLNLKGFIHLSKIKQSCKTCKNVKCCDAACNHDYSAQQDPKENCRKCKIGKKCTSGHLCNGCGLATIEECGYVCCGLCNLCIVCNKTAGIKCCKFFLYIESLKKALTFRDLRAHAGDFDIESFLDPSNSHSLWGFDEVTNYEEFESLIKKTFKSILDFLTDKTIFTEQPLCEFKKTSYLENLNVILKDKKTRGQYMKENCQKMKEWMEIGDLINDQTRVLERKIDSHTNALEEQNNVLKEIKNNLPKDSTGIHVCSITACQEAKSSSHCQAGFSTFNISMKITQYNTHISGDYVSIDVGDKEEFVQIEKMGNEYVQDFLCNSITSNGHTGGSDLHADPFRNHFEFNPGDTMSVSNRLVDVIEPTIKKRVEEHITSSEVNVVVTSIEESTSSLHKDYKGCARFLVKTEYLNGAPIPKLYESRRHPKSKKLFEALKNAIETDVFKKFGFRVVVSGPGDWKLGCLIMSFGVRKVSADAWDFEQIDILQKVVKDCSIRIFGGPEVTVEHFKKHAVIPGSFDVDLNLTVEKEVSSHLIRECLENLKLKNFLIINTPTDSKMIQIQGEPEINRIESQYNRKANLKINEEPELSRKDANRLNLEKICGAGCLFSTRNIINVESEIVLFMEAIQDKEAIKYTILNREKNFSIGVVGNIIYVSVRNILKSGYEYHFRMRAEDKDGVRVNFFCDALRAIEGFPFISTNNGVILIGHNDGKPNNVHLFEIENSICSKNSCKPIRKGPELAKTIGDFRNFSEEYLEEDDDYQRFPPSYYIEQKQVRLFGDRLENVLLPLNQSPIKIITGYNASEHLKVFGFKKNQFVQVGIKEYESCRNSIIVLDQENKLIFVSVVVDSDRPEIIKTEIEKCNETMKAIYLLNENNIKENLIAIFGAIVLPAVERTRLQTDEFRFLSGYDLLDLEKEGLLFVTKDELNSDEHLKKWWNASLETLKKLRILLGVNLGRSTPFRANTFQDIACEMMATMSLTNCHLPMLESADKLATVLLTKEQIKAIQHKDTHRIITGPYGSGKSLILKEIAHHLLLGPSPAVVYYICFDPYSLLEIEVSEYFQQLKETQDVSKYSKLQSLNINELEINIASNDFKKPKINLAALLQKFHDDTKRCHFLIDEFDSDLIDDNYYELFGSCLKKNFKDSHVVISLQNIAGIHGSNLAESGMTLLQPLRKSMRVCSNLFQLVKLAQDCLEKAAIPVKDNTNLGKTCDKQKHDHDSTVKCTTDKKFYSTNNHLRIEDKDDIKPQLIFLDEKFSFNSKTSVKVLATVLEELCFESVYKPTIICENLDEASLVKCALKLLDNVTLIEYIPFLRMSYPDREEKQRVINESKKNSRNVLLTDHRCFRGFGSEHCIIFASQGEQYSKHILVDVLASSKAKIDVLVFPIEEDLEILTGTLYSVLVAWAEKLLVAESVVSVTNVDGENLNILINDFIVSVNLGDNDSSVLENMRAWEQEVEALFEWADLYFLNATDLEKTKDDSIKDSEEKEQYQEQGLSKWVHFNDIPPVQNFFGREEEMEKIHNYLSFANNSEPRKGLVLTGISGLGKSETVRKYYDEHKQHFGGCIWINGQSGITFENELLDLGEQCGVKIKSVDGRSKLIAEIVKEIHLYLKSFNILYVFDDIASPDVIESFLPQPIDGVPRNVIVTSQNVNWDANFCVIPLDVFQEETALLFLEENIIENKRKNDDLIHLLRTTSGHPLALQQSVSYINHNLLSVSEYISLSERCKEEMLNSTEEMLNSILNNQAFTIVSLSIESVDVDLLKFMAYLDGVNIQKGLLLKFYDNDLYSLDSALWTLKEYFLISFEDFGNTKLFCNQTITIHSLTQFALREILKQHGIFNETFDKLFQVLLEDLRNSKAKEVMYWFRHILYMFYKESTRTEIFRQITKESLDDLFELFLLKGRLKYFKDIVEHLHKYLKLNDTEKIITFKIQHIITNCLLCGNGIDFEQNNSQEEGNDESRTSIESRQLPGLQVLPPNIFIPGLDMSGCLTFLQDYAPGTYLIRTKQIDEQDALAVKFGTQVKHYTIFCKKDAYYLACDSPSFATIADLIRHYYTHSLPKGNGMLKQPYR